MFKLEMTTKREIWLIFSLILFLGFLVRIIFVPYWVKIDGDLLLFSDWGIKFWQYSTKDFYFVKEWYYAPPNYPPIISLVYGASYWLFEHKYYLAELHNLIRIPPAAFIIYFYREGYWLLLKMPSILSDLGIALIIYKLVRDITKSFKMALGASLFYLFNPVSIFLSGVWGQTDSVVSLLGMGAFTLLIKGMPGASILFYFSSLYIKPNWLIFAPLYLFIFYKVRPKLKSLFMGSITTILVFVITTTPFAKEGILPFSWWLLKERVIPTATVAEKLSVSAFNFYTIFFTIDRDPVTTQVLGLPLGIAGWILFLTVNFIVISRLFKKKLSESEVVYSLFTIGFAGFLFLPNMLERYFFPSFIPLVILIFSRPSLLIYGLIINLSVFLNMIWAFFRRTKGEINDFFTDNDFLVIRFLSSLVTTSWFFISTRTGFQPKYLTPLKNKLLMLKFSRG